MRRALQPRNRHTVIIPINRRVKLPADSNARPVLSNDITGLPECLNNLAVTLDHGVDALNKEILLCAEKQDWYLELVQHFHIIPSGSS